MPIFDPSPSLVTIRWYLGYPPMLNYVSNLSDGSPLVLSGVKQHSILEIFFLAVGRRPELEQVFGPIGLDPGQPKHRKRK